MSKEEIRSVPIALDMQENAREIMNDIGFESRYGSMSPIYIPIIRRVEKLEEKLEAIMDHLNIRVIKERNVVVKKETK